MHRKQLLMMKFSKIKQSVEKFGSIEKKSNKFKSKILQIKQKKEQTDQIQ